MSEVLQGYTDRIRKYEIENTKNYIYVGMNLAEIQDFNYLEGTKYKNIKEYALDEFGYESTKTYNLISVYRKFFEADYKLKKKFDYGNYYFQQLVNMLPMTDDEILQCSYKMSVREIKEIRLKKSLRKDSENIENTDIFKNQCPGQNVITGVFPEKIESVEDEKEEKQQTIIVSPLPQLPQEVKPEPKIIVEVKQEPEQNYFESNKDFGYDILQKTIDGLVVERDELYKERAYFKIRSNERYDMIQYIYNELKALKIKSTDKIVNEIHDFCINGKLPDKLNFIKNVI